MLFSLGKIGKVEIKNRIVRSATFEGLASREGYVTDDLIKFYDELARGGTGLIITGTFAVDARITVGSRCGCLNDDEFIAGQKKLVETVHNHSDVKIGTQIGHSGRQGSHPKYKSVAPSPILYKVKNQTPRELTTEEIWDLITKFVAAGRRAYESGYDMVQLHGAHGYLLASFISPYTNKRTDEFGGSTEERTRILIEIYKRLRDEVGKKFPITVKMNVVDGVPGGITIDEGKKIAKLLVDAGYDAIEPSGGVIELQAKTNNALPSKLIKNPEDENFLLAEAKELRPIMKNCALIQVGGIRNPISAENMLQEDICDFISLSRPLIREPDLPNRWQQGDFSTATCISCNACLIAIFTGKPVHCVVKARLERKKQKKEAKP